MTGKISKLANLHGSSWGRIRPEGTTRDIFFNLASLHEDGDYSMLVLDQEVEFEEEPDRTNGTHAVRVRAVAQRAGA